jgi:hypothetical protein
LNVRSINKAETRLDFNWRMRMMPWSAQGTATETGERMPEAPDMLTEFTDGRLQ